MKKILEIILVLLFFINQTQGQFWLTQEAFTPSDSDNRVLAVTNNDQREFRLLKNPLGNLNENNIGIYTFWIRYDPAEMEPNKDSTFMRFMMDNGASIELNINQYPKNQYYSMIKVTPKQKKKETIGSKKAQNKWVYILLGIQKNKKQLSYCFDEVQSKTSTEMDVENDQPSSIIFFPDLNLMSGKYVHLGEFQFWKFASGNGAGGFVPKDFIDRYMGVSFKHYTFTLPDILIEYFTPLDETDRFDEWSAQIDTQYKIQLYDTKQQVIYNPLVDDGYQLQDGDEFTEFFTRPVLHRVLCPPGYRNMFDDNNYLQTCVTCSKFCLECSQKNETICLTCKDPMYLKNSKCVGDDCQIGQFFSSANYICIDCISPCSICQTETQCLYCQPGYLYIDDGSFSCVPKDQGCPANTYPEKYGFPICKSCPDRCSSCDSTGFCTSCNLGSLLSNGKCGQIYCSSGAYFDEITGLCVNCSEGCSSCINGQCNDCFEGYYLQSGKCQVQCTDGFFTRQDTNICQKCQDGCELCDGTSYSCSQCKTGSFLLNGNCVSQCPYIGYYQDKTNHLCTPCADGCEICMNSVTDCISCLPGILQGQRKCVGTCDVKQYQSSTGACFSCDSSCDVCYGSQSTQCTECTIGYFLYGSSCLKYCPSATYKDTVNKLCLPCKYFCEDCDIDLTCNLCKYGYPKITGQGFNNCTGEYYLKTNTQKNLNLPINPNKFPQGVDDQQFTVEIWFKTDDIFRNSIEIILGMSPYKLRKMYGSNSIDFVFQGQLLYCDSSTYFNLQSGIWYHYAFSLSKMLSEFVCYINGQSYDIGINSAAIMTINVARPQEITIGGIMKPSGIETNFEGYFKEFRYWNVRRTEFQIQNSRFYDVSHLKTQLNAYWKFDEVNDGKVLKFSDSSSDSFTYDPSINLLSVQKLMELREINLKICKSGYYPSFDEKIGYQICYPCHSQCTNCIGPLQTNCVECKEPLKLIQDSMECSLVTTCKDGQFKDPSSGLCANCNPNCQECFNTKNNCNICKTFAFRQYQGNGCVSECPFGMYGKYETQLCYFNSRITYLTPSSDSLFDIEDFIDLKAGYVMLNNEPSSTFEIGWIIVRQKGNLDISQDVVKQYYNTDLTRIHLDKNVLQQNNYYSLTFFVKGHSQYYNGLYSSQTHQIYVGAPPKSGKCLVSPIIGISQVTNFQIKQVGWIDDEPIDNYNFFYSMDGEVYIPIEAQASPNLNYTFDSTYQKYTTVYIKCSAVNVKGFQDSAISQITLEKRSSADASADLAKFSVEDLEFKEISFLNALNHLKLITQYLGSLLQVDIQYFDPRIEETACTKSLCNNNGDCIYQPFSKKYYCKCMGSYGGRNCTFQKVAQLQKIKIILEQLAQKYNTLSSRQYEFEFLKLCTAYIDSLSDGSLGQIMTIINNKVQNWDDQPQSQIDLNLHLTLASNMLEYIENEILVQNMTNDWENDLNKKQVLTEQKDQVIKYVQSIRQNQLIQVSMLDPNFQYQSRMISYKQTLMNQNTLIKVQASQLTKKSQRTTVKISPNNFDGQNLPLEQDFILEAVEYAFNPYEILNNQNIGTNVFEVSIYNLTNKLKANITNLKEGFEFSFPFYDNQNLSTFMETYNSLSPYKAQQKFKRTKMLTESELACTFWNGTKWNGDGCIIQGIDMTHVKCSCNHLTAFSTQFISPVETAESQQDGEPNRYSQSEEEVDSSITKQDLIVPLDKYFKNLMELLQHKSPQPMEIIFKPGVYTILLFWFMYITGLVYHTGRDRKYRSIMTKNQIRNDLAEIHDKKIQCIDEVIQEVIVQKQIGKKVKEQKVNQTVFENFMSVDNLIVQDTIQQNYSPDKIQLLEQKTSGGIDQLNLSENKELKVYEEFTKEQQKEIRRKAKTKVFGRVGGPFERADRLFKKITKKYNDLNVRKMAFFNESIKNTMWMSLMAKNSKIAPRHVRLTLMYFYVSLHMLISSFAFAFGYYDICYQALMSNTIYTAVSFGTFLTIAPWIFGIPVVLIFRMPHKLRQQIEGVRTRKINEAFKEIDKQMGCRYAIGYFICYLFYFIMSVFVFFFNYLYPTAFCIEWVFVLIITYFLDLVVFNFAFAGIQLLLTVLSKRLQCFYQLWRLMEVFRYYKNLRG